MVILEWWWCVSLLMNLLSSALTDLAIYDDRAIRGTRIPNRCKTLWSYSIGNSSSFSTTSWRQWEKLTKKPSSPVLIFEKLFASVDPHPKQWLWTQNYILLCACLLKSIWWHVYIECNLLSSFIFDFEFLDLGLTDFNTCHTVDHWTVYQLTLRLITTPYWHTIWFASPACV